MKMTAKQNANAITLLMTFSISVVSHYIRTEGGTFMAECQFNKWENVAH